ncbi:hypothetical protein [Erythrobacter sp. CCH5-A1]|uniref:hypothetical protein n=1 Tax=Erythrobacter sp. CCH5-A1 TaxID=1768792 RepID=UPI0018D215BB|nr:hypothetical protein [Erythrobacter sp. CCH5-A1]
MIRHMAFLIAEAPMAACSLSPAAIACPPGTGGYPARAAGVNGLRGAATGA